MRGNSCSGWSSPYVRLSVVSLKGFLGVFRWGESCWALLICIKNLMQKRRGQLDCLHREALKREVLKLQILWPNNRCTVVKIKCCNYKIIKQETVVCVPFSRFILHLLAFTHCDCDSLSTQSMLKGPGQTSARETVEVTPGLCKRVKQNGSIFFLSI